MVVLVLAAVVVVVVSGDVASVVEGVGGRG